MINKAKVKLSELVQLSKSFEIFKTYPLQDGSNAKVYKRKIDSVSKKVQIKSH